MTARRGPRFSNFGIGAIAIALVLLFSYWAFTRVNPFSDPYEFSAVFQTAQNTKAGAVVRIAGVNVGEVKEVEPIGDEGAARITMEISDEGLPIRRDAELKIRPRIFLEGNTFIDINPGSPSAEELPENGEIPVQQTATPVQFADVLAVLQSDVRSDLQDALEEFSSGLEGKGARGLNQVYEHAEDAYRDSAIVNEASLGIDRHDLSELVRGQHKTARGLARDDEALRNLVTNFNTFAAALAREDEALEATIPALDETLRRARPALGALNDSLPSLRAFAVDALPATRTSGPVLDANLPFIREARKLVSRRELRGVARELRLAMPDLVRLDEEQVKFLEQNRALSACQVDVLVPFAKTPIPDPDFPDNTNQPFYKQGPRGLVGLAGESRLYDPTSGLFHFNFGSGATTLVQPGEDGSKTVGTSLFPPLGVRPERPNRRPVFRPNIPCETQEPPNLTAPGGPASTQEVEPVYKPSKADKELTARVMKRYAQLQQHLKDKKAGRPTIDDFLLYSAEYLPKAAKKQGLKMLEDGRFVPLKDLTKKKKAGER